MRWLGIGRSVLFQLKAKQNGLSMGRFPIGQSRTMVTESFNESSTSALNPIESILISSNSDDDILSNVKDVSILAGADTIEHFGLDTIWPAGLVRQCLQTVHQSCDMPYGQVIILGVIFGRLLLLPLTLKSIQLSEKMSKLAEPMKKIQQDVLKATLSGDNFQRQVAVNTMLQFSNLHKVSPAMGLLRILPQSVFFTSYYFGIRKMALAPIASFTDGGFLSFIDLTAPSWTLSACCAVTIFAVMKINSSVDGVITMPFGNVDPELVKKVTMYGMPIMVLACSHSFPAAVLLYWCTSNVISMGIGLLLKSDKVRQLAGLSKMEKPKRK